MGYRNTITMMPLYVNSINKYYFPLKTDCKKYLLRCGLIMLIVATDVFVSASKSPVSVQFTLMVLKSSNTLAIVSVDISGLELSAEFLVKMKDCPLILSCLRLVWAADVINTLLFMPML